MDDITRSDYEIKFKLAFVTKKGNEFQDFFSTIMEKRHPGDFIRVRPWGADGDRKNDGYLRSKRMMFQVYAPNEMRAKDTISKINKDFKGALDHWKDDLDTWIFVHNSLGGLSPQVTDMLLKLDKAHRSVVVTLWGYEELRREIFMLPFQDLASLLGPPVTRRDMLALGMQDLAPILDHIAAMQAPSEPDLRPPPADKIRRNMLSDHVRTLLTAGMMRADLVRAYFRIQPTKQDEIAASFRQRYEAARRNGLPPDGIFVDLQRYAGGEAVPSASR